ncbi:taste receptor type 2 member 40-like [Phyllobates terribilis]|uniref:taste receptor type 2 member 40-like n=1 Tax=Phyllobates terribilis TaxID=111132 RepID=UPI003CCB26D1
MDSTLHVVFSSFLFVEILFGITINGFIVIVTWIEWKKHRQLHPSDQILLCLALSRSSLLLTVLVINSAITFFPHLQFHTSEFVLVVRLFFVYCSIWFGTILSVYYCVKITIYNNSFFMYIKTRISKLVPWFIGWSLLASLSSTLPIGWCVFTKDNLASSNITLGVVIKVTNFVNLVLIYNFASSPPLVLCCVSVVLLIKSIWFHTRTMQESASFQNLNMKSHFRILRGTSYFIFLYVSYYIIVNLTTSGIVKHNSAWIILCSILTTATPVLHSAYLIFSTSKLRRAFQSFFHFSGHTTQEVNLFNQ